MNTETSKKGSVTSAANSMGTARSGSFTACSVATRQPESVHSFSLDAQCSERTDSSLDGLIAAVNRARGEASDSQTALSRVLQQMQAR